MEQTWGKAALGIKYPVFSEVFTSFCDTVWTWKRNVGCMRILSGGFISGKANIYEKC